MDNSKKIAELEAEVDRLKNVDKENSKLPEEYRLATLIHSKLCRFNHTDGCSWQYETWDNFKYGRQSWVDKAKKILVKVDFETASKVISLM
tara:strand:+ start:766 stop:1038 length:273 start_codon:yes stop_codon:yes gene_type:complete